VKILEKAVREEKKKLKLKEEYGLSDGYDDVFMLEDDPDAPQTTNQEE